MGKVIHCECGYEARGVSDDDVIAALRKHLEQDHPDLGWTAARDDLIAMAEEEAQ